MGNWLWLLFFSLFWVLPIASRAVLDQPAPLAPRIIDYWASFCLFGESQDHVPVQYIQLLLPGATEWTTAEEGEYFSMSPFGYASGVPMTHSPRNRGFMARELLRGGGGSRLPAVG